MYCIFIELNSNHNKEFSSFSFKVKNCKHMHFLIQNVYKICYNEIKSLTRVTITTGFKKTYTQYFRNIKF